MDKNAHASASHGGPLHRKVSGEIPSNKEKTSRKDDHNAWLTALEYLPIRIFPTLTNQSESQDDGSQSGASQKAR